MADVQPSDALFDTHTLDAADAIELIKGWPADEVTEASLLATIRHEEAHTPKPRKTVLDALEERLGELRRGDVVAPRPPETPGPSSMTGAQQAEQDAADRAAHEAAAPIGNGVSFAEAEAAGLIPEGLVSPEQRGPQQSPAPMAAGTRITVRTPNGLYEAEFVGFVTVLEAKLVGGVGRRVLVEQGDWWIEGGK